MQAQAAPMYRGPYLGINTELDPSQLGQAYAQEAVNLLLDDGRIRPRPPFLPIPNGVTQGARAERHHRFSGDIYGMYVAPPIVHGQDATLYVKAQLGGDAQLIAVKWNQPAAVVIGSMNRKRPVFTAFNGTIYICDGGPRVWRTGGPTGFTGWAGIQGPNVGVLTLQLVPSSPSPGAVVQYAFSLANSVTGVESNAHFHSQTFNAVNQAVAITFTRAASAYEPADEFRVYRRNVTNSSSVWRLVAVVPVTGSGQILAGPYVDSMPESAITLSDLAIGPFAPTRNGLPTNAVCAAVYENRMYFSDGSRIRISALGVPDYVHEDDFVPVVGQDPGITGLIATEGGIVFAKRQSIHTMTGSVVTATNLDIASDAVVAEGNSQVIDLPTGVGPQQETLHGNGLFAAGEPTRIYFSTVFNTYVFDGLAPAPIATQARTLWRARTRLASFGIQSEADSFEYAYDPTHQLLFVLPCFTEGDLVTAGESIEVQRDARRMLVSHLGLQVGNGPGRAVTEWQITQQERLDPDPARAGVITAVCGGSGFVSGSLTSPLLCFVGTDRGEIYMLENNPFERPDFSESGPPGQGSVPVETEPGRFQFPTWKWRTGELALHPGMSTQWYFMRLLLSASRLANGTLRVRVVLDGSEALAVIRDAGINNVSSVDVPIQRPARFAVLEFGHDPGRPSYYDPRFGVLGWQLDTELIGAR